MSLSVPPTPANAPFDAASDDELLRANTPDALTELTDRYCRRARHIARAVLGTDAAATRAIEDATLAHAGRARARPPRAGGTGASFLGAVARRSIAARGAARVGALPALSDRQCAVVVLAVYGRLPARVIADELGLPARTVTAEMDAAVKRLAAAMGDVPRRR
jgi:DNA-directed RNA polymerase specialized sigma24 family protein